MNGIDQRAGCARGSLGTSAILLACLVLYGLLAALHLVNPPAAESAGGRVEGVAYVE